MEKDGLIVLSGGVDSVTLLHKCKDIIALAITFDYGSNHNAREIECAKWQCKALGIEHLVIKLDFMKEYFSSSLLSGGEDIPEGHYDDANMKSTVVPFRNGVMLSIAAGLAESRKLGRLLIANHGGDHAIYPDCRPEFIENMDRAIEAGTYNNIKIYAPFTNISKREIVALGAAIGVDYSHTYSCYKGGAKHCGKCGTCVERREAFEEADISDGVEYEKYLF